MPKRAPDKAVVETGIRISELRRARLLTQEALASRLNLSRKYIAEIEQGRKVVSLWRLFQIANALDVSASSVVSPPKRKKGFPVGRPPPPEGPYRASEFIGVFWRNGSYYGRVNRDGRSQLTPRYDVEEDAARARDCLAKRLLGRRARLNFP